MQLQNIDKKIIYDWMLKRAVLVILMYAATHLYAAFADMEANLGLWITGLIIIVILDVLCVIYAFVMPFLQYKRYKYEIKDDEIYLEYGVIFKRTIILPLIQLQDVGYNEGPIRMLLGLATLQVSTAGADLKIEGLNKQTAVEMVDALNQKAKDLITAKKQSENE